MIISSLLSEETEAQRDELTSRVEWMAGYKW